jgi:GNAT superfamily N-acetyltransferase
VRVIGLLHFDAADGELERHRLYLDARARRRAIGSPLIEELLGRLGPEPATCSWCWRPTPRRSASTVAMGCASSAASTASPTAAAWASNGGGTASEDNFIVQEVAKKRGVELANLYARLLREEALAQEPLRAGSLKLGSRYGRAARLV